MVARYEDVASSEPSVKDLLTVHGVLKLNGDVSDFRPGVTVPSPLTRLTFIPA
eukprot:CAMPEP_0196664350 /NCGR_PEP_ID=MMETSP1086-20130531/56832_1 /TAXON_ID=77921 /ORGANISM="Cyanoptyche  gloeocystis , Strain SAG4.97" /LENGTH=52 /DNA_ID=CAMNT_0042000621 /DNA_START=443 /DNA_END=601 /DNA_ORIENTATION=+